MSPAPFRIWWTGVSRLLVRTGVPADRVALLTPASARQAGLDSTVTCPVSLVRWQPNSEVGTMCGFVNAVSSSSGLSLLIFSDAHKHLCLGLAFIKCPSVCSEGVDVARLCRNSGHCLDAGNTHYCQCQAGYTGSYCEEQVDECIPNPCQNGATCTDYLGGYSCEVR